jgi:hypothetical protein
MNRYVVQGLISDMRNGKRVVYAARNQLLAKQMFDECAAIVPADLNVTVRRVAGDERIEDRRSKGELRCISHRRVPYLGPGTAQVAYLDHGIQLSSDSVALLELQNAELIRP